MSRILSTLAASPESAAAATAAEASFLASLFTVFSSCDGSPWSILRYRRDRAVFFTTKTPRKTNSQEHEGRLRELACWFFLGVFVVKKTAPLQLHHLTLARRIHGAGVARLT